MSDDLFAAMAQSIIDGDSDEAEALANQALAQGIDPLDAINRGFVPGVNTIGEEFSCGQAFLPELVMAGNAMKRAIGILETEMTARGTKRDVVGRVIMATVEGDIHDIGKTLVGIMLSISGFAVIDLGPNVPVATLVEKTREEKPDIVGLSALLTTTMTKQQTFIEALKEAGLRDTVRVMVGGAPVTRQWANDIGADGYSEDATGAVAVARDLLGVGS